MEWLKKLIKKAAKPKPTELPPTGTVWVYDKERDDWFPMMKTGSLKVGDMVVLKETADMEPGKIIKLQNDYVLVDTGDPNPLLVQASELQKVEGEWNTMIFDSKEVVVDPAENFKIASDNLNRKSQTAKLLEVIQSKIPFSDADKKTWIENENDKTVVAEKIIVKENFEVGDRVRRIASQHLGQVIKSDEANQSYTIKWDEGITSIHWKQELSGA